MAFRQWIADSLAGASGLHGEPLSSKPRFHPSPQRKQGNTPGHPARRRAADPGLPRGFFIVCERAYDEVCGDHDAGDI